MFTTLLWQSFTAQRPEPDDPTLRYAGAGRSDDKLRPFTSTPFYQALLPELREMYPDLPPPLSAEPDEARARLFEALCQLTLGISRWSPCCCPVSG